MGENSRAAVNAAFGRCFGATTWGFYARLSVDKTSILLMALVFGTFLCYNLGVVNQSDGRKAAGM